MPGEIIVLAFVVSSNTDDFFWNFKRTGSEDIRFEKKGKLLFACSCC